MFRRVLVCCALLLLAPAAAAAARVTATGGKHAPADICGASRAAIVLAPGGRARLRLHAARGHLIRERCSNGRWVARKRLARHARLRRQSGDFRIRATGAKPLYLRFGVGELVDTPFTARVNNVDGTIASCATDGGTRILHGHLTAPRTLLDSPNPSATLLVHGFGYAEFFWRFRAVPGYDTARELALAQHAVITYDRAGYGKSKTAADGTTTCIGSQADMANQLVEALKAGTYTLGKGDAPVTFGRVALVGHSAGGLIVELAAASFKDIDALGIVSYDDSAPSALTLSQLGQQAVTCAGGGAPDTPGFAPFGATAADFQMAHLNAPTDPAVIAAVLARRQPEPCGDVESSAGALAALEAADMTISGPVLLLAGDEDALFPPAGIALQASRLTAGGADVTTDEIPDAGHAITLGLAAPDAFTALDRWLTANQF